MYDCRYGDKKVNQREDVIGQKNDLPMGLIVMAKLCM
jgi:hypothetical protein